MRKTYPTARFGKTGNSRGAAENEYRVFYCSPNFPHAALREFEQLAVAMQWSGGGGDEPYDPCFAVWPLAGGQGILVSRFSDAGADLLHRPHTVLVEAAYCPAAELLNSPVRLANLLDANSWPQTRDELLDGELDLELRDDANLASAQVRQAFAAGQEPQRVFVASHPCYRVRGFDLVLETSPPSRSFGKFRDRGQAGNSEQVAKRKAPVRSSRSKMLQLAFGLLLLLCAGLGYLALQLNASLQETRQALEQERLQKQRLDP